MKRLLPAYPLFVKDPYFSVWAPDELLNGDDVMFWTGARKKMYGILKTGGKSYCFLGRREGMEQAHQTSLEVTAFSTRYRFRAGDAELSLEFVSPLPPDDLDILSCPVCYVKYEITGADGAEIIFAAEQCLCHNEKTTENEVRGGELALNGFKAAFFGLSRQTPLSQNDDGSCADWGYFYISGENAYFCDCDGFEKFIAGGAVPCGADREKRKYIVSSCKEKSGKVMLAYDDTVSINYFGDMLRGYYLENHTIIEALEYVNANSAEIDSALNAFGEKLLKAAGPYGESYKNILLASLRQTMGAHKLVRGRDGELRFLSKECHSNGCIATVDISYPSMPLFLLYNPELIRGMLRPVFEFEALPVWTYPFSPHDAGTYPYCTGQVYGMNDRDNKPLKSAITCYERQTRFPVYMLPSNADVYCFENQMPVEECANMLILLAACGRSDGKFVLSKRYFEVITKWADYLTEKGLKPENQLCTDDFAGHLGNNLNLAIKAAVGIACYAEICKSLGDKSAYNKYRKISQSFAAEISVQARSGHMPLVWDGGEDTFSLKYNLAFDKILGLGLFGGALYEREVDCYVSRLNEYGTPLDTRNTYTKSDWLVWAASLTDSAEKRGKLLDALDRYLKNTPDRVPFSDWYDTVSGKSVGFCNRAVQGGCFILLLNYKEKC